MRPDRLHGDRPGRVELAHVLEEAPVGELEVLAVGAHLALHLAHRRGDVGAVGDDVRRAGLSSLLARGLVQQEDGKFLPRSAAALLDYAAGAAERWTTVAITHDQGADVAVVLHAPEVVALMQPRALGSWFVAFAGSSRDPDTAVAALQDAVRTEHPEATFEVSSETLAGVA
jgi:hypothetical protein